MKEIALLLWFVALGFAGGIAFDQQALRSNTEQRAIERANRANREKLTLLAELDAMRRAAMPPDRPPDGERIPAPNPPLPVTP